MDRLPDLRHSNPSSDQNDRLIERWIKQKAVPGRPLDILEAGCGQAWWLDLRPVPYVLCGVDVDRKALEIRKFEKGDLHEIIEGDLRTVNLAPERFDVIYCSFVLEHVDEADVVLENFARWLKPGGLLIVRVPDPHSVRGFVTRITPHWFHSNTRFWYRNDLGDGKREFVVVDVRESKRGAAFDHAAVAEALAKATGKPHDAAKLPFDQIQVAAAAVHFRAADKNWKFALGDVKEREHWDEYMEAYEDLIAATSTDEAPWYVIPADRKWFMRMAVADAIVEALESLKLEYPEVDEEKKKELEAARALLLKEK